MKRQRGRGRNNNKPGMQNPNRAYESNGPDIKVRGSAQTILEKYQQLGRDAMGAGDRVLAENYLQHAEHYLRLIRAIQPNFVPRSELAIAGLPSDSEDEMEDGENNELENEGQEGDGDETETEERPRENYNRNDNNGRYNNNNRRNNNNNNNRNRDRYRNDNRQSTEEGENSATVVAAQAPETAEAAPSETESAPRNNSRVRGLRLPRKRREPNEEGTKENSGGFGDETPAFLQTPVAVAESE